MKSAARWLAAGVAVAAGAYATYVATTWYRYGRLPPPSDAERDELLDRFMPAYEVVERHSVRVAAPADVTLATARGYDLLRSPVPSALFRARAFLLGAEPEEPRAAAGLLDQMIAIGWGVLAEIPGREVVVGAVTRPWEANVTFRALPPEEFAAFREPGYVKIVWTLRADPAAEGASMFRTETRVATTDEASREQFRRYWSFLSPGIILIRWSLLEPIRREAERSALLSGRGSTASAGAHASAPR